MQLRPFGATGIRVSELGFGAWAIGGQSYGAVDRAESLRALARAEALVEQYEGAVTQYVGSHGAGYTVEFLDRRGAHIVVRGHDMTSTLMQLSATLRDRTDSGAGPAHSLPSD